MVLKSPVVILSSVKENSISVTCSVVGSAEEVVSSGVEDTSE